MRTFLHLIVVTLLILVPGVAQQSSSQGQPSSGQQQDQGPVFRKNVNLVTIYFTVKDKHNALASNLTQDAFQVTEEGKPQTIKYFSAESNQPLTLGILIDSSGSMQNMLPEEKIVGADFLRSVITDKDLAFILSFDISVDLLQDLTSDVHMLNRGLDKAKINVGSGGSGVPGIGQGPIPISHPKGTLLYDGIFLASDEMLSKQVGRKAVVVLTDGVDQGSHERLKDAIEAAQKADTICYVLLISDPRYGSDPHDMSQLAEQTGGRMITVNNQQTG